ncbi:MAG: hypothetical protein JOZ17_05220, partial [Acetobacteraceae bacterium]|nr:hypothetical protein [Acetobacteraceae bacterium]
MARTAAGQVSASRVTLASNRMLALVLIVALVALAGSVRASAQSAPPGAMQQAPFAPFSPYPPAVSSPAQTQEPATRRVERSHVRHQGARPHRSQKVAGRVERKGQRVKKRQSQKKLAAESGEDQRKVAEANGYKRVSDLVNFPKFFPGLGIIYVKPDTLPTGPFLCFDRQDRLVATVYMIPIKDIEDHKTIEAAGVTGPVDHVSFYFNPGHPGVEMPHYHFVIWHVSKKD